MKIEFLDYDGDLVCEILSHEIDSVKRAEQIAAIYISSKNITNVETVNIYRNGILCSELYKTRYNYGR